MRLQAKTVLVVDDDAMLARIVGQVLQRRGLKVTLANSFEEAFSGAQLHKVGVFDIDLGDGNGVDLAEQLIALGRVSSCVFFTGGAEPTLLDRARTLGEVFRKSGGPNALVQAVVKLMGREAPAPAASG
jgi:ActR/RegA family two-component response regulator